MIQFDLGKKLLQKYEPIALDVSQEPIDISKWSDNWRTFKRGKRRWRINDVEVTEAEWQIVYYCLHLQREPEWTDELTKWDFIDLDEAVERILERVQTESAPDFPKN